MSRDDDRMSLLGNGLITWLITWSVGYFEGHVSKISAVKCMEW